MQLALSCLGRLNSRSLGPSQPPHGLCRLSSSTHVAVAATSHHNALRQIHNWNTYRDLASSTFPVLISLPLASCSRFNERRNPRSLYKAISTLRERPVDWSRRITEALRTNGNDGVLQIWAALETRREIPDVNAEEADFIWDSILRGVLRHGIHPERLCDYATWLLDEHLTEIPHLYRRTVSFCLRRQEYHRAFHYHMRLAPRFGLAPDNFGSLLREHIADLDPALQNTLVSLYMTSLHRGLYDILIPYLFDRGRLGLCKRWRELFIASNDLPLPNVASQPFLRFFSRYYPSRILSDEERTVLDLAPPGSHPPPDSTLLSQALLDSPVGMSGTSRSHRFNDGFGSRWFASSWIPLDFAIHTVYALGVRKIGPLSLQSMGLREPKATAVAARLKQLTRLGVDIGQSTYARAIRHFTRVGNDELLRDLLQTDIHPDVFENRHTQRQILHAAVAESAWKTHRLLLAIQSAITQDSIESTSNELLQRRLEQRKWRQAVGLFDDMKAMNLEITPRTLQTLSACLVESPCWSSPESSHRRQVSDAILLVNKVAQLPQLLPSKFWQAVLMRLGHLGRFEDLEHLAVALVDIDRTRVTQHPGLVSVHRSDTPTKATEESFMGLPPDLPITHNWHPVGRIFTSRTLQAAIVRWGFQRGLALKSPPEHSSAERVILQHPDFYVARGVQLLKQLKDRDIPIEKMCIRDEVLRCLTRHSHDVDLSIMSKLFNLAYDDSLLPSTPELRDLVVQKRHDQVQTHQARLGEDEMRLEAA